MTHPVDSTALQLTCTADRHTIIWVHSAPASVCSIRTCKYVTSAQNSKCGAGMGEAKQPGSLRNPATGLLPQGGLRSDVCSAALSQPDPEWHRSGHPGELRGGQVVQRGTIPSLSGSSWETARSLPVCRTDCHIPHLNQSKFSGSHPDLPGGVIRLSHQHPELLVLLLFSTSPRHPLCLPLLRVSLQCQGQGASVSKRW